jgi:hypothetical protein
MLKAFFQGFGVQTGHKQHSSSQAQQENTIYEVQMQADQAALGYPLRHSRAHGSRSFSMLAVDEAEDMLRTRLRFCSSTDGVTGAHLSIGAACHASIPCLPPSV